MSYKARYNRKFPNPNAEPKPRPMTRHEKEVAREQLKQEIRDVYASVVVK